MKEPIGRFGSFRPGPRSHHRLGHRSHRFVLADDARVQFVIEVQQLFRLAFQQLRHRDARPTTHDLPDVLRTDPLRSRR